MINVYLLIHGNITIVYLHFIHVLIYTCIIDNIIYIILIYNAECGSVKN